MARVRRATRELARGDGEVGVGHGDVTVEPFGDVVDFDDGLEKRGLLDTWRQSGKAGRPQMLYPFEGIQREVYEFCEEVRSRGGILEMDEPHPSDAEHCERDRS